MRIAVAVPEAAVKKPVLDAALEATTRLNEDLIKRRKVPTFHQALPGGIRWKPEPPGQEHFDHAGVVLGRGWGDCDDLAPWQAASLRVTGEDPDAEAVVVRSGPKRWHAIVKRSDGRYEDPSREAGMGRSNGIVGAWLPLMYQPAATVVGGAYMLRPQLALRPVRDQGGQIEAWQARADLPWHELPGRSPGDVAMASLHASPVSSQSIVGACHGLIRLAEANGHDDEEAMDRLACIRDACDGASYDELLYEYGPEHAAAAVQVVGGFFGGLLKGAGKLLSKAVAPALKVVQNIPGVGPVVKTGLQAAQAVMPLAKTVAPFIPGVGPAASAALEMASPALQAAVTPLPRPGAPPGYPPPQYAPPPQYGPPPGYPYPPPPYGFPYGFSPFQRFG